MEEVYGLLGILVFQMNINDVRPVAAVLEQVPEDDDLQLI